ncbi:MAG TPA: DM13 domain-containing protein [Fimbriimonas sp.]|nr:DM13 domain-containing protein [Fimbriimonas sp.]
MNQKNNLINKKTIALAILGFSVIGWALFRPELLFVNKTVNEALPVDNQSKTDILATGTFISGAHETKGNAQLVRSGTKTFVRFTDFSTSNGPDVRVIVIRGNGGETSPNAIDLGSIKGNIGDQNYELPEGVSPSEVSSISIWCKRFSVGFGSASLSPKTASRLFFGTNVGFGETVVTSGIVRGSSDLKGKASIVENAGKRVVRLQLAGSIPSGVTLKLVKKESLMVGPFDKSHPSIDLGAAQKGSREITIPKDIDAWLYRSVAVIQNGKIIAFVNLRSSQEKQGAYIPASLELA